MLTKIMMTACIKFKSSSESLQTCIQVLKPCTILMRKHAVPANSKDVQTESGMSGSQHVNKLGGRELLSNTS
jgi:hypothetical protein